MNELNQTLRRALALATPAPLEALEVLDSGLARARADGDVRGVCALAKHAGVVATAVGDHARACTYYEEALRCNEDDPYLNFARGDAHRRLGALSTARAAFERTRHLAAQAGDMEMVSAAGDALTTLE